MKTQEYQTEVKPRLALHEKKTGWMLSLFCQNIFFHKVIIRSRTKPGVYIILHIPEVHGENHQSLQDYPPRRGVTAADNNGLVTTSRAPPSATAQSHRKIVLTTQTKMTTSDNYHHGPGDQVHAGISERHDRSSIRRLLLCLRYRLHGCRLYTSTVSVERL